MHIYIYVKHKQKIDIEIKGQGHSGLIIVHDTGILIYKLFYQKVC